MELVPEIDPDLGAADILYGSDCLLLDPINAGITLNMKLQTHLPQGKKSG